jgi:hypothetical protein
MNWYKIFYWLTVADNAKTFFATFMTIFTIFCVISTIWFVVDRSGLDLSSPNDGGAERAKKWMWWCYPFAVLFWGLYILTPEKKDALLIIAGGGTMEFLTNDSTAKQIPHEMSSFVITELRSMAEEAKVSIGINNQRDKLLNEAKQMSAIELMEKMQVDSNFAKVILNK